jgi:hypothetical protein
MPRMPVSELDQQRRKRFRAWAEAHYGAERGIQKRVLDDIARKGVCTPTRYDAGRMSQIFSEKYEFGEEAARNLALALELPETAFLVDPQPPSAATHLSPQALELAVKYDRMESWARDTLSPFLNLAVIANPPKDAAEKLVWAAELANLLRASLERLEPR